VHTAVPDGGVKLNSSFLTPVNTPDAIQFTDGHGWGHAVGMCQWCAQAMALQGRRTRTSCDFISGCGAGAGVLMTEGRVYGTYALECSARRAASGRVYRRQCTAIRRRVQVCRRHTARRGSWAIMDALLLDYLIQYVCVCALGLLRILTPDALYFTGGMIGFGLLLLTRATKRKLIDHHEKRTLEDISIVGCALFSSATLPA